MKLFLASNVSESLDHIKEIIKTDPHKVTVAFITTAANPYKKQTFIERTRNSFSSFGFNLKEIDIAQHTQEQLYDMLGGIEFIFVCGGNTFYLLEKTLESGFDQVVKYYLKKGVVYGGESAGSILAGPNIWPIKDADDPSVAPSLEKFEGLNLVDFIVLPHMDSEKYGPVFEKIIEKYNDKYKLIPLKDSQAVIVEDNKHRIVGEQNA